MFHIKKGLHLPLSGAPSQQIDTAAPPTHVALLGCDYPQVKPTLMVEEGESVVLGQPLLKDKKHPRILFTAPASGRVTAINRGYRRAFLSLVIQLEGNAELSFPIVTEQELRQLSAEQIEQRLLESGLWTALRTRPYNHIPPPESRPVALFVTAIDTNPLAPDPRLVIEQNRDLFSLGLQILQRLVPKIHLCTAADGDYSHPDGISVSQFTGPHPAGLVGTHIHFLEKVDQHRTVWHIGYQDVIAIGHLFGTGQIMTERIISLAGPPVKNPRLLRIRHGANLTSLVKNELSGAQPRLISGSVFSGHQATEPVDFLGRYHNQVTVLGEDRERSLLGWLRFGLNRFSVKNLFVSGFLPSRPLPLTTSTNGSSRAMVPVGAYEKVMPLNIKATWLLRSLMTLDTDLAQKLGCLELAEEDLALCSFVCAGKIDYGHYLRQTLTKIEEEG